MNIDKILENGGVSPIKGPPAQQVEQQIRKAKFADEIASQQDRAELQPDRQDESRTFQAAKLILESIPDIRQDRVELARRRLASGFYDKPEIRTEIAARMIADPETNPAQNQLSAEEIAEIRVKLASGYYNQTNIRDDIAKGMIDDTKEE